MAVPAEREPRAREQLPKAPEGTYAWLKQYDGFEAGMSLPDKPLLCIAKEEVCQVYGGSCMEFLVHTKVPRDTHVQHVQIEGHITDQDEIVDLARVTYKITERVGTTSRQKEAIGIAEAMQEVRSALSALKDAKQAEDF